MLEPRISPPAFEHLTPEQREVYEAIASGPRGTVRGPLAIWLHRPELAMRAQAFGSYCRYETLLEPRLSELAILTIAALWGAEYEWSAHKPIALEAGVSQDVVEALRVERTPVFAKDDEAVVHDVTVAAQTERRVENTLYARARQTLGRDTLVDLVGLLGYYTLISLTINVFHVPPPPRITPELSKEKSQ